MERAEKLLQLLNNHVSNVEVVGSADFTINVFQSMRNNVESAIELGFSGEYLDELPNTFIEEIEPILDIIKEGNDKIYFQSLQNKLEKFLSEYPF